MDFIIWLVKLYNGVNALWVIVDRLTKTMYFLPIKDTNFINQLEKLYVQEIIRLHGVPKTIVSSIDMRFVSAFYRSLH